MGDREALMHFTVVQLDSLLNQTCLLMYHQLQQQSIFLSITLADSALCLIASFLTNLLITLFPIVLDTSNPLVERQKWSAVRDLTLHPEVAIPSLISVVV